MDFKTFGLSVLLSFSLISCGDIFMKADKASSIELTGMANCELDFDSISHILEKNIKGDIECLGLYLNDFVNLVETDRPGYVSKSVLKNFILNGPIDVEADTAELIDTVFDLSHLIIGTDKDYLKNTDVDVLIDFLIYFNENIIEAYKYFSSKEDVNYSQHQRERRIVFNKITLIANKLKTIFKANRKELHRIDTQQFVLNFFNKDPQTLEEIRAIIFLKRVFLGGDKWDLTHVEFADALEILPEVAQVALDVSKMNLYTFKDEQETLIKFFLRDIEVIKSILYYEENSQTAVFTLDELIHALNIMAGDMLPINLKDFPRETLKIKEIFFGEYDELFYASELYRALNHLEAVFAEGSFGYRIYNFFRDELNSPDPISHDLSSFPVSSSREKQFRDHYAEIAANYKFFKGENSSAFYTHEFRRNPNAFFQISALEYGVHLIMSHYGRTNVAARGGVDLTMDHVLKLITDLKWLLRDAGLIVIGKEKGREIEGTANNFMLLSTLFQYQSDGCDEATVCLERPEATEFILNLLTALSVKDSFTEEMTQICATEQDEYGRIYPDCFRRNFINVLKKPTLSDGNSISHYMPELTKYLESMVADLPDDRPITESEDYMHFITETEAFTRSCTHYDQDTKLEEIPLKATDAFAVFAGLLNIESTVLRYDLDQNNVIDYRNKDNVNEVMNAYYSTYEGAIKSLVAPDGGIMTILAKPIYKYLIRYGKVPDIKKFSSIWSFLKFLLKRNKNADAHRVTFATVLKVIGEQQDADDPNPFKCDECFRDPTRECEPADDAWND
ncbi:MAG: hypothetical protein CME62_17930 [Halobacteriovoraceae bacterium]|nr:hypothetical protein [Halobacteriovoraceae bacterium]|tara:strand:- start:4508 stop:6880 length:2373 start_codon:yes stop_codon:yes gene_type:complete